jgi:hypothetical protein
VGSGHTVTGTFALNFRFTNVSASAINPMIGESFLKVNGKEVVNWELTINNGPRDNRWTSLPAGDHLEFTYAMGAPDFSAPGTYDVVWVVQGHESKPFRIEVAAEPTNRPVRVTISQFSRPPVDRIIEPADKRVLKRWMVC